ncbi:putative peptidase YuxL [Paenibacillus sp. J45TS6]|uniref:S9 family peptidase n=1 Tax=Paenibacillus sp. J45TS6 TaxID=2807196 RepID=UPI001B015ACF|nr:S9 family peptidase [Paenibacillus sp. J45TS6]GIP43966.1 putative peptidase YuxL [Paenibacillus sp. J45TS6]
MSEQRVITAEDLYRLVWTSDPSVSPNGDRIAYVSKKVNPDRDGYHSHIRILERNSHEDMPFTNGEQDSNPLWSPDGSKLAFLRNKEGQRQIWTIAVNGGEAQVVTSAKHGVSGYQWSPDSSQLLYRSQTPSAKEESSIETDISNTSKTSPPKPLEEEIIDRLRYKADGSGRWNGRRSHLFVHTLGNTEANQLTTGDYDIGDFCWSPDGSQIAFTSSIAEEHSLEDLDLSLMNDVYVMTNSGENRRKYTSSNTTIYSVCFSPDGHSLAVFGSDHSHLNATHAGLYIRSLDEDAAWTPLTKSYDIQLTNSMVSDMRSGIRSNGPVFSEDGAYIYALVTREGGVNLAKISVYGEGYEWVSYGKRDIYQFELLRGGHFILAAADLTHPGDLYELSPETGQENRLTQHNEQLLNELIIATPEEFQMEASDGAFLQGWIMKPTGTKKGDKIPTVLEIHGGPHAMYGYTFIHEFQLLVARGYAVIYTNPRGGYGYSQEFVSSVRGDYGGRDYQDLMEFTDYAVAHYDYIDEKRLLVTGGSYGGFMTNWIVGHTNRFKAAVTQRSISNWISFYGVSDIGFFFTEDQIGGNVWENTELLWKHSPLAYVHKIETPLLILHGEEDLRCPIEQAEQLFNALKRLGKKTQFIRFPKANHDLSRGGHPGLRVKRLNHIVRWFDEHKDL